MLPITAQKAFKILELFLKGGDNSSMTIANKVAIHVHTVDNLISHYYKNDQTLIVSSKMNSLQNRHDRKLII